MREILDYLVSSLSEYYEIIEEKLRHFNNIIPGRTDQFTLENARQLVQIVPGISSPELLHCEFQLLKNDIDNCAEFSEIIDKLKLVGKGYPNAKKVYKFLLTLPVTVATNERSFSKLKLLKNTLRSTLNNDKMEWLILCSIEKDLLQNIDLSIFAEDWSRLKNRRIKVVANS
jgi:hypothetical protein